MPIVDESLAIEVSMLDESNVEMQSFHESMLNPDDRRLYMMLKSLEEAGPSEAKTPSVASSRTRSVSKSESDRATPNLQQNLALTPTGSMISADTNRSLVVRTPLSFVDDQGINRNEDEELQLVAVNQLNQSFAEAENFQVDDAVTKEMSARWDYDTENE